jgi:hypothetical protein
MKSGEVAWEKFNKNQKFFYLIFTIATLCVLKFGKFHGVHDTNHYLNMSSFYLQSINLENWFPVWVPNYFYGQPSVMFNLWGTGPEFNLAILIYRIFNLHNLLDYYLIYVSLNYLISFIFIIKLFQYLRINFLLSIIFSLMFFINIFPFIDPEWDMRVKLVIPIIVYICLKLVLNYNVLNLLMFIAFNIVYLPFGRVTYTVIIIYYFELFLILMLLIYNRGIMKKVNLTSIHKSTILMVLLSVIIAISYLLVSIYIFQKEIALTVPGRQGAKAPFKDFVFYGGYYGQEKLFNLLFGSIKQLPNPINYYTANSFLGLLPLSFIILFITNYRSLDLFSKKILNALISTIILILLFSLPSIAFLRVIFNLPGMPFVRHTSYYFSAITFLIILSAAILFNDLINRNRKYPYIFLYFLLSLTLIKSNLTLLNLLSLFILSLFIILFWKIKQVSRKNRLRLLCLIFLIINFQITILDILKYYPYNLVRTNFTNSDYYVLNDDYFSSKRYSSQDQMSLDALSINNGLWGAQYPTDIFPANLDICGTDLRIDFLSQEANNLFEMGYLPTSCALSKFRLFRLIDKVHYNYSDDLIISNFKLKANSLSFDYAIKNFEDDAIYRIEYQDSYSSMWTIQVNYKPSDFLIDSGFKSFAPPSDSGVVQMHVKSFYLLVFQAGNLNFIFIFLWILFQQFKTLAFLISSNSLNLNLKKE